jgi:hypothetical protein
MKYLSHIAKSEDTKDWVRVEAEVKGKYAHQMTEAIRECQTDNDLKNLILSSILDHYSFYYINSRQPHKITKLMLEMLDNKDFRFYSPSPRDNTLMKSIDHIIRGSGLLSTIYKIDEIWGRQGVKAFMNYIKYEYLNFEPNDDHRAWVRKRRNWYRNRDMPWKINIEGVDEETLELM